MFNPLKGLGDLRAMQQQAQQMQQALQQEEVVVEHQGVRVVLRGDQQVKEVTIDGVLENRVSEAINDAIKKTQELAAKKLIEISQQHQEQ
jgi:DNA-binding protein YbaB